MSEVLNVVPSPTLAEAIAPTTEHVTTQPESPPEDKMSSRFAALARKQKALEIERKNFQAERLKVVEPAADPEYVKWKEEQAKAKAIKKSPIEVLMEAGYSYEDATNFVMNDGKITPELKVKEVESKLETYIREQKEREEAKELEESNSVKEAETKAIEGLKAQISEFVTENKEKYEMINLYMEPNESSEQIYQLIDAHYEETKAEGTPKILSKDEAADMLEAHLEELAEKSLSTNKFKNKNKPAEEKPLSLVQAFTAKTLSSTQGAAPATPSARPPAKSEEERMQRALALLKT